MTAADGSITRMPTGTTAEASERVRLSVVMAVRNEVEHVQSAIEAVLANDIAPERLEVIVVDGASDDGTRELVAAVAREHSNVRLLDNPQKTVPHALNLALAHARGDVIVRIDGHAIVAPDFLRSCLTELALHPECGCVGGAIENQPTSVASLAISLAMSSPFGVGTAHFRTGKHEGYVDTLAFGAYRREVFEKVGTFDESLVRNQDDEFNFRLRLAGYRIWLSPHIKSKYIVRSDYSKLFRQYYQYGCWKVYVNRKHGRLTNLRQLAPSFLLSVLFVLCLGSVVSSQATVALGLTLTAYLTAASVFAGRRSCAPAVLLRVLFSFMVIHFSYGLGYLEGVVRFALLGRQPRAGHAALSR